MTFPFTLYFPLKLSATNDHVMPIERDFAVGEAVYRTLAEPVEPRITEFYEAQAWNPLPCCPEPRILAESRVKVKVFFKLKLMCGIRVQLAGEHCPGEAVRI